MGKDYLSVKKVKREKIISILFYSITKNTDKRSIRHSGGIFHQPEHRKQLMTHQAESTILDTVVTTILDNGFDGLAKAVTMLLMVERLNREINCSLLSLLQNDGLSPVTVIPA